MSSDPHAADAHGHAVAHAHDEAPTRTEVPPFEKTPWGMILVGIAITGAVLALGLVRNWEGALKGNPNSRIAPPGNPSPVRSSWNCTAMAKTSSTLVGMGRPSK